jgi:hypothetical protein
MGYQEPYDPTDKAVVGFATELMAVFHRWFEESDLDEFQMECAATDVIEQFCGTTLDFDSDMDWEED